MKSIIQKSQTFFIFLIPAILIINSCGPGKKQEGSTGGKLKGTISISGAFALYPITVVWAEEFQKQYPGVRIDISAGGAGKGMTDVLSGMVDLAMFSREVSAEEVNNGAWKIAVTKDAVLPTINAGNPFMENIQKKGMKKEEFQELFLKENTLTWGSFFEGGKDSKINVYNRSDACGAAEMWGKYLGGNQESLEGVGVYGDPGMADAVKNDVYGIGFNNVVYVYDMNTRMKNEGLEVMPIDLNADGTIDTTESFYSDLDHIMAAIGEGRYPSPPARELYFISKGKPADATVLSFLEWILTEGQAFVNQAGYVRLPDTRIEEELKKIKPEEK